MRTLSTLLFVALCSSALLAPACTSAMDVTVGEGPVKGEPRQVASFSKVASAGSIDVMVEVGPETSVIVEAEENVLPRIRTRVEGDTLEIDSEGSWRSQGVTVRVTTPQLVGVDLAGSGSARIEGARGELLELEIAGSGTIAAAGASTALAATISGSGDIHAFGLEARTVSATVSGSGDVEVHALESLNAVVSGSGDIRYRGQPKVTRTVAGSGDVRPAE